jgi:iron complex outermembrane recepter protein
VADFSNITMIAPSMTGGMSANGPGLGESKNSMRGFKDGEFNITWDGIPFGDTNGPTHHSTAYFPAGIIDSITVERGPGNASNIGQATFGGSLNMFSLTPKNEFAFSPYAAVGSWNTKLMGVRLDSGAIGSAGESRLTVNAQTQSSDGYRTYSNIDGQNLMVKYDSALTSSTLLTVFLNYNQNYYNQPDKDNGLTLDQARTLGKNYVLSNDPKKANYFGYNRTDKDTVFNYIRVQSDLGEGWAIDNKAYYYHYMNKTIAADKGNDPTAGLAAVKDIAQTSIPNQMPGYFKLNTHWVTGDVVKATKETTAGLLRVGVWVEKAETQRATLDLNLLTMAPNYKESATSPVAVGQNINYLQGSGWLNYQPFAEFEWAASKDLTVTPGIKFMNTRLNIDAPVNATARQPQQINKEFTATLPFLTANYKLDANTSTYAQYAKGMLVPDISSYQSLNADASSISPQTSTNYQLGVVHKTNDITLDADVYFIDFNNKIALVPGTDSQPVYYNQGGVIYKGLEGQITYALPSGFSVYANGSINSATSTASNAQISLTPDRTAALGLIYQSHGWTGTLVHKYIGEQYALDNALYKMNAYAITNLSVGYQDPKPSWGLKALSWNFGVYNIFNNQDIIAVKAKNTDGSTNSGDTFLFNPATSFMFSMRGTF